MKRTGGIERALIGVVIAAVISFCYAVYYTICYAVNFLILEIRKRRRPVDQEIPSINIPAIKEAFSEVIRAASECQLTDTEIDQLSARIKELGVDFKDNLDLPPEPSRAYRRLRATAFGVAVEALAVRNALKGPNQPELRRFANFLNISDDEIEGQWRMHQCRARTQEIKDDRPSPLDIPGLGFKRGETAFGVNRAFFMEQGATLLSPTTGLFSREKPDHFLRTFRQ